ncbi:hypothetical protein NKH18_21450 [Streptomyces sp. M10(2022)]
MGRRAIEILLETELPDAGGRRLVLVDATYEGPGQDTEFTLRVADTSRRVRISDQDSPLGIADAWQRHSTEDDPDGDSVLVITGAVPADQLGWDLRAHAVRHRPLAVDRAEIVKQLFGATDADPGWPTSAGSWTPCWKPSLPTAGRVPEPSSPATGPYASSSPHGWDSVTPPPTPSTSTRTHCSPGPVRLPARPLRRSVRRRTRRAQRLARPDRRTGRTHLSPSSPTDAARTPCRSAHSHPPLWPPPHPKPPASHSDSLRPRTRFLRRAAPVRGRRHRGPHPVDRRGRRPRAAPYRGPRPRTRHPRPRRPARRRRPPLHPDRHRSAAPSGYRTRLRHLAGVLHGSTSEAQAALRDLAGHHLAALYADSTDNARTAVRLVRWLQEPLQPVKSVAHGVHSHLASSGWADLAVGILAEGDASRDPAVADAYQRLIGAVRARRATLDEQFAQRLALWSESASRQAPGARCSSRTCWPRRSYPGQDD